VYAFVLVVVTITSGIMSDAESIETFKTKDACQKVATQLIAKQKAASPTQNRTFLCLPRDTN
jgi:hypothetical protein